jgi:ferritin-like metal-binding protein YciE
MAGYGTLRAIAEALELQDAVGLLQQTLDEEGATDKKLTQIAEEEVLGQAASSGEEESEEEGEE